VRDLCRQSFVEILSSLDRCRPCQWLVFPTGVNQAAVAVGSEGIGGVNPKVFCDRRPLCDLQDTSLRARLAIFRRPNSHYDPAWISERSSISRQFGLSDL
tara:strand:+ start:92384 stop:92683 length:300 start_codon:yes stop_codon:yes gene_type:complete